MRVIKDCYKSIYDQFVNDTTGEIQKIASDIIDLYTSNNYARGILNPFSYGIFQERRKLISIRNEFGNYLDNPERNGYSPDGCDNINTYNESLEHFMAEFKKIRDKIKQSEVLSKWYTELSKKLEENLINSNTDLKKIIENNTHKRSNMFSNRGISLGIEILYSLFDVKNTEDNSEERKENEDYNDYMYRKTVRDNNETKFTEFCESLCYMYIRTKYTIYTIGEQLRFINSEMANINKKISVDNYTLMQSIGNRSIEDVADEYKKYLENLKTQMTKMRSRYNNFVKDPLFSFLQTIEI